MRSGCLHISGQEEEELGEEIRAAIRAGCGTPGGWSGPQHHVLLKRNGQNGVCWGEGRAGVLEARLRSLCKEGGDRTQGKLFVLSLVLSFGIYDNMFCLLPRKEEEEGEEAGTRREHWVQPLRPRAWRALRTGRRDVAAAVWVGARGSLLGGGLGDGPLPCPLRPRKDGPLRL